MVFGSRTRAEKRNACSGGSSFGCVPGSSKPAPRAEAPIPSRSTATATASTMRFSFDPVEIRGRSIDYRQRDNFRQLVGVDLPDCRLHLRKQHTAGLDGDRHLVSRFDLAVPVIN